jgi:putative solute:sodium symporter small subunit
MPPSKTRQEYWNKNLRMTAVLLLVWFLATFPVIWFVRDLNALSFLGFPLGFYMAAQGSLVIYVALVWFYARHMNKLDKEHGVAEE